MIVGVIDTGIRHTHEDIAANMWTNPGETGLDVFGNDKRTNGVDDDHNGYVDDLHGINAVDGSGNPFDKQGHGSHTAGTIAAVGNNGVGVAGVAWRARVMALKFLEGTSGATSDAVICLDYAVRKGVRVVNASWGGGESLQALHDAIAAAGEAGVLFVAAAGNSSSSNDVTPFFPANYPLANILTVAATDRNDALAGFSNFGPGSVELAAPGVDIWSLGMETDSSYAKQNGTSMAAPHVAGVAALLAAQFPASGPVGIKNRILQSTRTVPGLIGRVITGGVVNLAAALQTASDAPRNDNFARSIPILEDPTVIRGNNIGATMEPDEPLHAGVGARSIWYRWTAEHAGRALVTTYGSSFDTVLAAYAEGPDGSLVEVAANDDVEGHTWSRVEFEALAGRTYHVAVAGKNGASGFTRVTFSGPAVEDNLANAPQVPGFPFTYSSDNTTATREPGEPLHAGVPGGGSLWIRFTLADAARRVVLNTRNSEFDTLLAVYTADVPNPGFADLTLVAANDDAPYGGTFSEVSFTALQGRTYWIATDGKNGARGIVRMSGFAKPANDDFATPVGLVGDTVAHTIPFGDIRNATREFGEPVHDNAGVGKSLWYLWSPATPGRFNIRTDANTALGVYTGEAVDALSLVAPDQNDGRSTSLVSIAAAQPATVYRIAVDSRSQLGISANVRLTIARALEVPNDRWADATGLAGVPTAEYPLIATGDNAEATVEPGEPAANMAHTIWFRWVAPVSGEFMAHTTDSAATAAIRVYQTNSAATGFANLGQIASAVRNGVDDDALARFTAVAGRVYYFQIGMPVESQPLSPPRTGAVRLTLEPFRRPPNDDLANAEEITGFFIQRELRNFGATREDAAGEPPHATDNHWHNNGDLGYNVLEEFPRAYATLWYKWTPTADQIRRTSASLFGSQVRSVVHVYQGPATNPTYADLVPVFPGASSWWWSWWAWGEDNWTPVYGKTYYIMVGMNEADHHEIQRFSFWQNPNDNFADRQVLAGTRVSVKTANFAATFEPGEPVHVPGVYGGRSIWYEWTAPESGTYILDTIDSFLKDRFVDLGLNPDGQNNGGRMHLAVYTGSALG